MVYKFCVLSDEVDDFRREIEIDADATFLDLNKILLKTCEYKTDLMTSFFLCDDEWERKQEITAVDMNDDPKADPIPLMEKTHIGDMISADVAASKAKMIFVFDTMCDRSLFIQVREVIDHKHLLEPVVTLSKGKAPKQEGDLDDIFKGLSEETSGMYGDDEFDPSELDEEGFQDLEDMESTSF